MISHQTSSESPLVKFHWDYVPHFAPTWAQIEGKAHLYKTAKKRSTGEIVRIIGVTRYADGLELVEPMFKVRDNDGWFHMATEDLCGFVL